MAISYTDTTWDSVGTNSSGTTEYKDLLITGCQVGDVLVVFAAAEQYQFSGGTRSIVTQSGSTSAWTTVSPAVAVNSDVDFVAAYATVTGAGSVTVRGSMRTVTQRMGVGAFLIPAADVGSTFGFVGSGFTNDADGLTSATLSTSSTVLYMAGDWSAANMGSTSSPSGATVQRSYFDTSNYSVWAASWTGQASGTRNYGPSGLSGHDVSGVLFRMDTAAGGSGGTVAAVPFAVTLTPRVPVVSGSGAATVSAPVMGLTAGMPALDATVSVTVAVTPFTPTLTPRVPAVGVAATVQPPTLTGSVTPQVPTVTGTAATVVSAPTLTAIVTTPPPSVVSSGVVVAPVAVAAGTARIPAVVSDASVAAPTMGATTSCLNPGVSTDGLIVAPVLGGTLTARAPMVGASGASTVTAEPLILEPAAHAPTISAAGSVTAASLTAVATASTPSVTGQATVTAATLQAALASPAPGVTGTGSATVVVWLIAATAVMLAPVLGESSPIPAVRTLTGAAPTRRLRGQTGTRALTGTAPTFTLSGSDT